MRHVARLIAMEGRRPRDQGLVFKLPVVYPPSWIPIKPSKECPTPFLIMGGEWQPCRGITNIPIFVSQANRHQMPRFELCRKEYDICVYV
jgi:hypothetical protein